MNMKKTLLGMGLAAIWHLCAPAMAGETRSATIRPDQDNPAPTTFSDVQPMDTVYFNVNIVTPDGYTFSHTGWDRSGNNQNFLWTRITDMNSKLVNTAWESGTTTVNSHGYWNGGEGGGSGEGGGLIHRWATGVASAGDALGSDLVVKISPEAAGVGNGVSGSAFGKRVSDSGEVAVKANWSVSAPGYFNGGHTDTHSVQFSRDTAGEAQVTAVNDGPPQRSGSGSAMFVEVVSISAVPAVVCAGSTPDFTVTTSPTGYTNLVDIAYNPNVPGPQEVIATCGTSAATCTVTVVKLEINEPVQVTRGENQTLSASLYPAGLTASNVVWIFTGGKGGSKDTGQDLSTSLVLVDGDNPYTAICKAMIQGIECEDTAYISVIPRNGWTTTPYCAVDNDEDFGEEDFPSYSFLAGRLRNRLLKDQNIITPTEGGFTCVQVNDQNGPNDGYWYIESTTLEIDMETVINKYIKPGTVPPDQPGTNWHEYNESMSVDADGYLEGLNGHEFRGVPESGEGHFAYLEAKASEPGMDVRKEIEALWDTNSYETLEFNAQQKRDSIELSILFATAVEPSGNWGPGIVYVYDYDYWLHTNKWLPMEDSN